MELLNQAFPLQANRGRWLANADITALLQKFDVSTGLSNACLDLLANTMHGENAVLRYSCTACFTLFLFAYQALSRNF